jgi:bisphosphoglycerate-dependent phosphoglycerate mutase
MRQNLHHDELFRAAEEFRAPLKRKNKRANGHHFEKHENATSDGENSLPAITTCLQEPSPNHFPQMDAFKKRNSYDEHDEAGKHNNHTCSQVQDIQTRSWTKRIMKRYQNHKKKCLIVAATCQFVCSSWAF